MQSIVEQVFEKSKKTPEKVALLDGKRTITFGGLAKNIVFSKKVLEEKYGIKRGDYVVIAADKQLEFVSLYFSCHLIGATTVPIAPDTNANRYNLIKDRLHPVLVVGFKDENANTADLSEFLGASKTSDVEFPDLNYIADIMFTTGTTGDPKGVQLSQRNIAAAARNINTFIQNSSDDVEMIALPISHSFGIGRMRCALSNGQTVVMLGQFTFIKKFFSFIEEYKVTGFGMVPASWAIIKKYSGMRIADYKNQLHYIEIGSAPMPIEEKLGLIEALPDTRICMHYGLTEASRSAFMEFHESRDVLTTVGKESPNMHIVIKDENGRDVPVGEDGEICVAGDAVTVGYLNLPKEDSFWGEYFRTGDWGFIDRNGLITLRSRKKELINVGGKKVSPMEVEAVLLKLDFIEDCACLAVPDPDGILGEVVKAYVVTNSPEKVIRNEIDKFIGKQLEDYKHPRLYEVISEIPKTSSGKVQRLKLKQ